MKGYANPQLLTSPEELRARLDDPALLVLDVRPAEAFAAGAIPGAVHLDLWGFSLIDTSPAPLASFLWMIEHVLALRGVTKEAPIALYEETSGIRAARVFWFLEHFGCRNVSVLDGGYHAWTAKGLPTAASHAPPRTSEFTGERRAGTLAVWSDVRDRLGAADLAIVDARTDDEYYGTVARAARGGAIPGAVHIEWTRNLDEQGAFKPAGALRAMYEAAGVTPDREVITYCQGGYRAAHAYLALRLLGYPRVRNYLGSWKEWGDRRDLPVETPRRPASLPGA
jgi:thiosulfate/3-mercaptopyruvate sulfurtransferase